MLSVHVNEYYFIMMPSLSFPQPAAFKNYYTEQCLDDATVAVVVGIIRYAFVFCFLFFFPF